MKRQRNGSGMSWTSVSLSVILAALVWLGGRINAVAQAKEDSFAKTVADLSEPGGYFDTDNLISNEKSYLHALSDLERRGVSGGVYVGVGPDQNFSYIARIRPAAAIIVDIRRDNLLLHLLFKAIFGMSRNRMEYLGVLTGRQTPDRKSVV